MVPSRDLDERDAARERRPRAAPPPAPVPAASADVLLGLQRTSGNASVARWLRSASGLVLQRDELTVSPQMPEVEAGELREAWALLQELDAKPASADEIQRVTEIAHANDIAFLGHTMLERIRATPNTRLVVTGGLTSRKKLDEAGGTRLVAQAGERVAIDVGYGAALEFADFMASVPNNERKQVRFEIRFDIKIPFFEHARAPRYGVAYFLETLMHELALHGEKYAERIVRWRESTEPWAPTFEYSEHQEHMYAGNPRYMLLLRRLYEASARTRAVPPELLTALEHELDECKVVYTREGMTAPEEPPAVAAREMLGWIDELKQGLDEPAPAEGPQAQGEDPVLEPLPRQPPKTRMRRLLDWLLSCVGRRQPD